jgi:transposase-like protein
MHILKQVPSTCTLRRILKQAIFGKRVHCPHCGSRYIRTLKQEERWRCTQCQLPFSIKSSCWLKGSKLPLETIWLLLWCWQKKFTLQHAQEVVGVSYPTVSRWYQLCREHIPKERIEAMVGGQVVCDEMFTRDTAIMGVKEKGTRNVMLKVLHNKHPNKSHAVDFLTRFTKANSDLFTDGSGIYKGIGNWHKLTHTYEIHSKFEFSLTAEIEGLWGVFRTFVRRMYHHVTKYKLEDLVAEFCLRFRQDDIFNSPSDYWRICLGDKPFAL